MKKQFIFLAIILFAGITTVSCKRQQHAPRTVDLNNMNDSVNYAFGYVQGDGIGNFFLHSVEDKNAAVKALIDALDKAFNSDVDMDELYQLGVQIGSALRQMEDVGLLGEESLTLNSRLVKQGLRDGVKGTSDWSTEDAEEFFHITMMQIQEERARAAFDLDMSDFFMEEEIIDLN